MIHIVFLSVFVKVCLLQIYSEKGVMFTVLLDRENKICYNYFVCLDKIKCSKG